MTKKATDVVAYLSVIGWLLAYFGGDRAHCEFHLNQGLVFAIGELVLWLLDALFSFFLIRWLLRLLWLALLVLLAIAVVGATRDEERPVPFLGSIRLLR